jgi:hypothetical protein
MIIVDYMRYRIMLYLPVLLYLHLYLLGGRHSAILSAPSYEDAISLAYKVGVIFFRLFISLMLRKVVNK